MQIFDHIQDDGRAAFAEQAANDPGAWTLLAVALPAGRGVMPVARQVYAAAPDAAGALFIQDGGRLTACLPQDADLRQMARIAEAAGGTVALAPLTAAAAGTLAAGGAKKSTLYRQRAAREKNLLMIVDDDALACAALGSALEKHGERIVFNAAEGVVDAYVEKSPDIVFLDSHLSRDSGFTVLSQILRFDRDAHVLMLTADTGAQHAKAAKEKGAKSFLAKPFALPRIEYELFQCPTFRRYVAAK